MKIVMVVDNPAGTGPPSLRILGDDTTRQFISGWAPEAWTEIQTAAYPRADLKRKFARGNGEFVMTFTTDRAHADYATAQGFIAQELSQVRGMKGSVVVNQIGASGGGALTGTNAVVKRVKVLDEVKGVSTRIEYTIEGADLIFSGTD